MDVILLEKVTKLGTLGTRVKVKPGFARNYLIPKGKALPATVSNIKRFEETRAELERAANERLESARQRAAGLEGMQVIIAAQTGEEGRLFGSVGSHDIVRALLEAGHHVAKGEVRLPELIRAVGEHEVQLHLQGGDIVATIKVKVVQAA